MLCWELSPLNLWKLYVYSYEVIHSIERTTFYFIVKDLTLFNHDIVTSVDYVQALFVMDPVEILQQIANSLVHTKEEDLLTQYITAALTVLKSLYQKHVLKLNNNCINHDLNFVLGRYSSYNDSIKTCDKNKITCP